MNTPKIFEQLSILHGVAAAKQQRLLEIGEICKYSCGDHIYDEGNIGDNFFVVLDGQVDILLAPATQGNIDQRAIGLQKVAEKLTGESFGEMGLLDHAPRMNTAICSSNQANLLRISQDAFQQFCRDELDSGYQIVCNIAGHLFTQLRTTTAQITEQTVSNHYLHFLCQELYAESQTVDGVIPLEKKLIIRDRVHFMLSGPNRISPIVPNKEEIDLTFFAAPDVLHRIMRDGTPSGAQMLQTLFSLISHGGIRKDITIDLSEPAIDRDGRSGHFVVHKQIDASCHPFFLRWEVKGLRYDETAATTTAAIFIYMAEDATAIYEPVKHLLSTINMPIQQHVLQNLPEKAQLQQHNPYHLFVIHHRTHEVAITLRSLKTLGFHVDTFIGIPYGETDWPITRMLDYVSSHNYQCLRIVDHPTEPRQYHFDFQKASFLQAADEALFTSLYAETATTQDYMAMMKKLVETGLVRSIQRCQEQEKQLLIYEDGGYVVPLIYQIYQDPSHAHHKLFKQAVDSGLIVGAVEVTVAGERRDLAAIESNGGKALLPVLSTARDDLKSIFEAKGVSQAVIDTTSTALGRLGLPTFETREIAIIGGNGAIGTRLVEELTEMQNSTSHVFSVDIVDHAFAREIDSQRFPYSAIKVDYLNLGRYPVKDSCLPLLIDLSFGNNIAPDRTTIEQAVQNFFATYQHDTTYDELVITNSFPNPASSLQDLSMEINRFNQLWQSIHKQYGYAAAAMELLPNGQGMSQILRKPGSEKKVTLLAPEQILSFKKVTRLIQSGVDIVIGISGLPVFDAQDFDAFLTRQSRQGAIDELVLVSGSSKDYEFKKAIVLFDQLLQILSPKSLSMVQQLEWYSSYAEQTLCFMQSSDCAMLVDVFASPRTPASITAKLHQYPDFLVSNGLNNADPQTWPTFLVEWIRRNIKTALTIHKSLHKDIGTVYHIQFQGQRKRLVLLANGFVINFFAKHEKGVKTEYIDPIVTMQLLGLIKLATTEEGIAPGVYRMAKQLRATDMDLFWQALDDKSCPINFGIAHK